MVLERLDELITNTLSIYQPLQTLCEALLNFATSISFSSFLVWISLIICISCWLCHWHWSTLSESFYGFSESEYVRERDFIFISNEMQYIKISFERLPTEDLSALDSIRTRMKISLVSGQQIDWESVSDQLIKTLQDHSIWLAIHKKNFQPGSYRINKG